MKYNYLTEVKTETLKTGRTYYTPDGAYPSITTILGKTADNTWLQKWIERVGEEEAARVSKEATDRGTLVHEYAERHFNGEDISDLSLVFDSSNGIFSDTNNGISKKVSFLFGSEASGLTNDEVSYADYTLQIPSNSKFRSLNLSHSLVIVAQTVSYLISINKVDFQKSKKIQTATKKEISSMLNFCLSTLENQNFFKQKAKKPIMIENLRSIFYKMELSKKEIRILSSVFAGLAKKP